MASDPLANAVETFSVPIESMITAVGQGIADAQRAMDLNSVQMQEVIDSDPVLSQYGLQAPWYQFPKVDLQLTMSVTVTQDQDQSFSPQSSSPAVSPRLAQGALSTLINRPVRVVVQPVSASFQSHFNYSGQAASQVNLSIVPVPAPRPGDQVTVPPRMKTVDVQKAALTSTAKFVTAKDGQGNTIPANTDAQNNVLRFDLNFNASSRTWYALQYAPANKTVASVVVAVDDATGALRIISTP